MLSRRELLFALAYGLAFAVAYVLLFVMPAQAALADSSTGELCAVQTEDSSLFIAAQRSANSPGATLNATPLQLQTAGAACTNRLLGGGWVPASSDDDGNPGQVAVCLVDSPRWYVSYWVYAVPTLESFAEAAGLCREIRAASPYGRIEWNNNDPVWITDDDR